MRPKYEPSVTSATGEVDRQSYFAHEAWPASPRVGRNRMRDEYTLVGAAIVEAERHAGLARAVREVSQRLLFGAAGVTPKYQPAVAGATGEADRQFHLAHEIRPKLARVSRDRIHAEHPSVAAEADADKSPEKHAGLALAIREASQQLHLQRELWSKYCEIERDEAQKERVALETAIVHVDSDSGYRRGRCVAVPQGSTRSPARRSIRSRPHRHIERRPVGEPWELHSIRQAPEPQTSVVTIPPDDRRPARQGRQKRLYVGIGVLIIAAVCITGLYARNSLTPVIDALRRSAQPMLSSFPLTAERYAKSQPAAERSPPPIAPAAVSPARFSLPLPDSYGLYALNDGRLTRIESMRIRVPDARIALPGLITTPSPVVLPDGRLRFIAYQRDLVTSAPDTASIRIIARVARALTFAATGRPKVHQVENTWAIREVSGEMAVAPIPGRPEMILIKPSDPDLALSPGRYMLVFKNQAYDFTVDGAPTDPAQCLERSETQDGNVYTECPGAD